MLSKAKHL